LVLCGSEVKWRGLQKSRNVKNRVVLRKKNSQQLISERNLRPGGRVIRHRRKKLEKKRDRVLGRNVAGVAPKQTSNMDDWSLSIKMVKRAKNMAWERTSEKTDGPWQNGVSRQGRVSYSWIVKEKRQKLHTQRE